MTWILSQIPVALSAENPDSSSFFLSNGFIYPVSLIIACVSGFGDALQWVAHGTYIQECATEQTKGFYFAYFWSFYMFSQVIGNLIGAFVLGSFNQSMFFLIMAGIAFSSTILFVLLPKPLKQKVKS